MQNRVERFVNMSIHEENISLSTVRPLFPVLFIGWFGNSEPADGRSRRRFAAGGQVAICTKDTTRIVRIRNQTDHITQVSVVELAEVCGRPALQIRRTSQKLWRHQCPGKGAEMLKGKIERSVHRVSCGDEFHGTSLVGGHERRKFSAVVVRKQVFGEPNFLQIADALNAFGTGLSLLQRGQ